MVTQQDILDQLTTLKNKDRSYLHPEDYKKFLPNAIPNVNKGPDTSLYNAKMQTIMDRSNSATLLAQVKAQNSRDFNQMLEAQQAMKRAQRNLSSAGNINYGNLTRNGPRTAIEVMSGGAPVARGGARGVGVGQNLGNFNWKGRNLTLNRSVGNRFVGFLNALAGTGYKIGSIGTYANRNIAGSSTKSLHAYGLAMDINPGTNPVSYGHVVTNLPRGVGRLAAKYGLVWGGNWNGPKYDAMHFSVPYGGRK